MSKASDIRKLEQNDKLLEQLLNLEEGVYDPNIFKAIFLAGGPGSGKSFVADTILQSTKGLKKGSGKFTTGAFGLKVVNSDQLFELLTHKAGYEKIDMTSWTDKEIAQSDARRSKAKAITANKQNNFLRGRLGMVIDGTGHKFDKIKAQKSKLEKLGYDTGMIFVQTSSPRS